MNIDSALYEDLVTFLENSRRSHYYCEDYWYSCPKHPYGCADSWAGDECNCGADEYNAKLDRMIERLTNGQKTLL